MDNIIGIMGAMPEEIDGVVKLLENRREYSTGRRIYYSGSINGIHTVVVFSRWGKVAAATTAATLVNRFSISKLLFTGVAGAIHPTLRTGDVVVSKRLIQHDLDARPLIKQFEIPLLDKTFLEADPGLVLMAEKAVNLLLQNKTLHKVIGEKVLKEFNLSHPKLYTGDVASGDQFFYASAQKKILQTALTDILCVEMEGAAVAQVCYENEIPFVVIRTISDDADEHAPVNFPAFVKTIASAYSSEIIKNIYSQM